jgi:hypothetical protein
MSSQLAITQSIFATNAAVFGRTIDGIPEEKWLAQPGPDSNPLLWIAGHLVVSRSSVLKVLGQQYSVPWAELFVRGVVRDSANKYPSRDEIVQAWGEVSDKVAAGLKEAPAELLSQASPHPRSFDGTVGGTIAFLGFHESYHVGQMGYLRKWLGYGQVVG